MKTLRIIPFSILCLCLCMNSVGCASQSVSKETLSPSASPTAHITPTPAALQVDSLHSLCVSYLVENAEGLTTVLPALLQAMGYEVMQPGEACDANLNVRMTGSALSDSYQVNNSSEYRTCFTGAKYTGEITLSAQNAIPLVETIDQEQVPPNTILNVCPEEASAPYQQVWSTALVRALKQVLGDNVIIAALQVPALQDTREMLDSAPYSETLIQGLIGLLDNAEASTRWHAAQLISYLRPVPEAAVIAAASHLTGEQDAAVKQNLWGAIENAGAEAKAILPQLIASLSSTD